MSKRLTDWFPVTIHPVRDGWYELDSGDRLHWNGRAWGVWQKASEHAVPVRFNFSVASHIRWRGLAEQP